MKIKILAIFSLVLSMLLCLSNIATAQVIDPARSANAAAVNDKHFISDNIQDNQDDLILLHKALTRATDPRIKDLAQQMTEDHTTILYAFQEINSAGSSVGENASTNTGGTHREAVGLDSKLSGVSGSNFDTMWVANMLARASAKFDELTNAKASVTNPQLQRAVSDAIPLIRKHRSELNILQKEFVKAAMQAKKQAAHRK